MNPAARPPPYRNRCAGHFVSTRMQTKPFDVRAARERLEMDTVALAAELGVAEGEVRAWESRSIRVPRRARRMLKPFTRRLGAPGN